MSNNPIQQKYPTAHLFRNILKQSIELHLQMNQLLIVFICLHLNVCFDGLFHQYAYIIVPLIISMMIHLLENNSCYEDIYWTYILSMTYQIP